MWDGVADRLGEAGATALTVDLRGHGRSSKPDGPFDVPTVAGDLATLIEQLGLDRPVVAGQSWGGNVAVELAGRHPDLVRGIVCVDGGWLELSREFAGWDACRSALAPPRLLGRRLEEVEGYVRSAHPDWPESGIRGVLANFEVRPDGTIAPWLTYERHIEVLRGLWEHHPSTRYASIGVPVLLVPAVADGGSRPDEAASDRTRRKRRDVEAAAAAIPNAQVRWLAGDHDRPCAASARAGRRDAGDDDERVLRVTGPRILAIMGSGETAPTMAKVHRALFERLESGAAPMPAAILDTPYGFQENADELSSRTLEFFATSVGRPVAVASYRSRDVDGLVLATAVARIREARYVMAGPGSPSYALRQWAGGPIPDALAAKLADGGILTMASAAALTVGVVTIPVYEVYKVGRGAALARGARPPRPGDRPARGRRPPLRQRRGRHPRHPLLLHGRAAPADAGGGPARRRLHPRRGQPHRARAGPRGRDGRRLRPRRGHRPGRRAERRVHERQRGGDRRLRRGGPRARGGQGR